MKKLTAVRHGSLQAVRLFAVAALLALVVLPGVASATSHTGLGNFGLQYATNIGLGTKDIRVTVAQILRTFMGLLGIVAIVIVLYGGFLWMTAAGNEERLTKAKEVLTAGIIGLVIIVSAFALTQFVISSLLEATT